MAHINYKEMPKALDICYSFMGTHVLDCCSLVATRIVLNLIYCTSRSFFWAQTSLGYTDHMLEVIWGSTASTGVEQLTRAGYTQSLGMGLGSWLISEIWNNIHQVSHWSKVLDSSTCSSKMWCTTIMHFEMSWIAVCSKMNVLVFDKVSINRIHLIKNDWIWI